MTDFQISIIPSSVIIWCVESYSGTFSFWSIPDNPLRTVEFSSTPLNSNSSHEKLNRLAIFVLCLLFEVSNRVTTGFELGKINRYRRGLETCPQVKTSKSGHAIFFFFFPDASERRVWLSAESKILAFTFERFCLYRLKKDFFNPFQ